MRAVLPKYGATEPLIEWVERLFGTARRRGGHVARVRSAATRRLRATDAN
jgi:hypothetical protein